MSSEFKDVVELGSSIWDVESFICETVSFDTYLNHPFVKRVKLVDVEDFEQLGEEFAKVLNDGFDELVLK